MTLPINYQDSTALTGALSELPATTARGLNAINAQINSNTTTIAAVTKNVINVCAAPYNADNTGATPSDAAFLAAYTAAVAGSTNTFSPDFRSIHEIYVPPGTYLINGNGQMIADLAISATCGIRFRGGGVDATMINFAPSAANGYLCTNQNDLYYLTFENMSFYCSGANAATATFMKSNSTGTAQNYVFNHINWDGTWKYGLDLTGTNNNSELTWFHCSVRGNWTSYLHAGVASTSDQFLNYNFFATNVEYTSGDFIDMALGGNVNVWGGSLIHIGNGTQTTSSAQCFFKMGVGGGAAHAQGVQRLYVAGVRVEHRHENSQLIRCGWSNGMVAFVSCDTDSMVPVLTTPTNVVQAEFGTDNYPFPNILFQNCSVMGKHKYHHQGGSYQNRSQIEYRNCNVSTTDTAASFITFINDDSTTNVAGKPPIKFDNCRGTGNYVHQFDCTVGWPLLINVVLTPKTLVMKMPWGGTPLVGSPLTATLPLNAVITRVRVWKGASGASTSTAFTYTLADATPTTIVAVSPGTAWNAGWTYDSGNIFNICDTDTKRALTLSVSVIASEFGTDFYFLVDYLA